jgi:aldehyde dehydrogenase (NAD+)
MWNIDQAYIDGAFVPVQGSERLEICNPATERAIGTVTLANREDAKRAIAAANRAQPALARSTRAQRIDMLRRLEAAVLARTDRIREATI